MKMALMLALIMALFGPARLSATQKLIFSDRPAFKIGKEIYYYSDYERIKKNLDVFKCLYPKSILLELLDYRRTGKRKKMLPVISAVKMLKLFEVDVSPRYQDYVVSGRMDKCAKTLNGKDRMQIRELFLFEVYLKKNFGSVFNSKNKNNAKKNKVSEYMKSEISKLDHHVFL